MVDLTALMPQEMAQQLGRPEGEVGRAIGEMLNRANGGLTEACYDRLDLAPGLQLLEIGPGNGRLLPSLMGRAAGLGYVGLDIAPTMIAEAEAFNTGLVAAGQAEFRLGGAEAIPYPDAGFDRVFAINVFYFWPDPLRALAEMRRVLRPGGLSLIAAVTPEVAASTAFAREEYGFRARDGETVAALHREAGFATVALERFEETVVRNDGTPWVRIYSIVTAHA